MPSLFKSRKVKTNAVKRKIEEEVEVDGNVKDVSNSNTDGSDNDNDNDSSSVKIQERNKKRSKLTTTSSSTTKHDTSTILGQVKYDHSHKETLSTSDEATRQSAMFAKDSTADSTAGKTNSTDSTADLTTDSTTTYNGKTSYSSFLSKREDSKSKFGPVKSAGSIRSTTMIDYQPDVCKDYKQTGYCGYGDSCKFLHSREDYKAGWKLDKDWEEVKNSKKEPTTSLPDDLPQIPFKCVICKNDYKDPVVTQCEHYFCESCFINEYRKSGTCFICGNNTNGVVKPAKGLKKLLLRS